jgi:hypothetical protein
MDFKLLSEAVSTPPLLPNIFASIAGPEDLTGGRRFSFQRDRLFPPESGILDLISNPVVSGKPSEEAPTVC